MRRSVSPPLRCLGVDKQIRLLLDHDGPRFVNFEVLARDGALQARLRLEERAGCGKGGATSVSRSSFRLRSLSPFFDARAPPGVAGRRG
eukprot:4082064-Pyramimonas_sp.AAC.1